MPNYNFQKYIIKRTIDALKQNKKPVIQSHPGSGKTKMAIKIATQLNIKTLIIVPWREIKNQIEHDITDYNNINVMTASGFHATTDKPKGIELLILDEAHHAVADTYIQIVNQYPSAMLLGLTGTLIRMDGQGFEDLFDTVIEGPSVKKLINYKVLSPYKLYTPNIDVPLFNKKRMNLNSRGEYSSKTLRESLDVKRAYAAAYKSYMEFAPNKTMILYAPSVSHAIAFAKYFNKRKISANVIHNQQSDKTRNKNITDFKSGKIKILCNYNVISEGFNMPQCDGVILLRPTRSLSLYIQQAMRAMRYQDDKTAIIIDHTLNSQIFGSPSSSHIWRLESEFDIEKSASDRDDELTEYTMRKFYLDPRKHLIEMDDLQQRIIQKEALIKDIKSAIRSNKFSKLVALQKKYNIGFIESESWAYKMAHTYHIPLPPSELPTT